MKKERPPHLHTSELGRVYGFEEREVLDRRLSDNRFRQILEDEGTRVHHISEDYNNYGEFLFVTVSREAGSKARFLVIVLRPA